MELSKTQWAIVVDIKEDRIEKVDVFRPLGEKLNFKSLDAAFYIKIALLMEELTGKELCDRTLLDKDVPNDKR